MAVSRIINKMAAEKADMDMTPMIDVTFLLLIFFMCTLHFKTLEGMLQSYLPKDQGMQKTNPVRDPQEPITIKSSSHPGRNNYMDGRRQTSGSSEI